MVIKTDELTNLALQWSTLEQSGSVGGMISFIYGVGVTAYTGITWQVGYLRARHAYMQEIAWDTEEVMSS